MPKIHHGRFFIGFETVLHNGFREFFTAKRVLDRLVKENEPFFQLWVTLGTSTGFFDDVLSTSGSSVRLPGRLSEENNCFRVTHSDSWYRVRRDKYILCCNSQIYPSSIRAALTEPSTNFYIRRKFGTKELVVLVEQHTDHGDIIVGRVTLP